jgi:two-component system OmpR family response regulator
MRVLVVEDEPKMARLIKRGLEGAGLAVDIAPDGEEALWRAPSAAYDAIVLDRMLPGIDGTEVARRLRAEGVTVPVLMLTALGEVPDRVGGLDAGADDYLVKPFSFDELLARLRALARRGPVERPPVLTVGELELDPARHELRRAGVPVALTAKEFALMEAFMRHPGQVLSRLQLLDTGWDGDYENRSNVVDVHVAALREKVGRSTLETVRGVGYRLCAG